MSVCVRKGEIGGWSIIITNILLRRKKEQSFIWI